MAQTKPVDELERGELDMEIADLGKALASASSTRQEKDLAIERLTILLSKLKPGDYPELAQNPAVQKFLDHIERIKVKDETIPPGTIINPGSLAAVKKDWQWKDLDDMPRVTFTPVEDIPVIWNGLRLQFFADREITVPFVFKDIYDEHRRAARLADQHIRFMLTRGPVPDDPTMLSEGSVRVRGTGTSGSYHPGAGNIILTEGEMPIKEPPSEQT